MAIKISGPYKGFFITVEATPALALARPVRETNPAFAATAYIYRHAPSGDGRGMRFDANHGRRFASISDAFLFGEAFAQERIDEIDA
ncbi:hypothetical protein [Pararobbsia alpina]|uniref:Uncharacterized protein n=1 Tax=Pararobbsia alpina TaxID=621374 RepID=A0A6S7AW53_9BURK|nr:hypothetical protein [Pararobbsia alpina]CAB3779524.1 hypothetical protein LMG28138_00837 [Pararobbsia alpina]